ncbi:hypothetical protein QJQ45_030453, partial [Haematococcus lacustris]
MVIQYNTTLQAYMTYYLNPNIISHPTWNMAIGKYMARCIYISWLLLAAGDIEKNPGPDGLHFEQQVASHCQVHALNMAAGHSWLTNQELANFHTSELHARRGDQRTMWALARDEQGACNDTVINLYLMSHYGLSTHTVAHLRTRSDWSARNLDALSATHGTKAFLCKAPAHSMAIRKHDGAWYLLDSQADAPTRLRSTGHYMYPVTCEIQAIISTANHTAEMEAARQRARLGPIISNPQETHRPYWERQYKQCCLVHAINMAMGIPMIRPDDVITHCKTLDTHIQDLANKARQENRPIPLRSSLPHIYEESGNFTVSTMNHYLYHHHKDLHLCPTATELTLGNITPELLTTLTGNIDSYTNTAAILITNNHATTIRRTDHTWHWLDSEQGRPCRLDTPEDWLQLKGTLVQIKKGDAADTNLIHPLCWLADPTRRATTEQLEQHLRTTHIDLTTQDLGTQPAHTPRTDRPLPTAQPASYKRILTATADTHPTDKQARPRLRQVAPTVTLPTLQDRSGSSKRPTSSGTIVDKRRTKPREQPKDSHTQTLMYRYLNTTPTPPPAAIPTTPPPPTANLPEHPGPHPQHNTLPTRRPQPTHNRQHITLTTLNVRSLHRSRNDVLNLVHQHSPDILILTETMTQPKSNNPDSGWLKRVMPDYTTHRHRGHSEVLIGIKHNLAIQMKATMLPPSIDAEVNARCVILTLNQHQCEQLTIIATYWPSGNNGDALLLRGKMHEHIRTATGHLPGSLILAGDINATMKTEDRSEHTEYTQDSMMRGFATEMHLKEADPGDRAWTYQQPHCTSRIDAILTRDARHGPEHRTHVDTNVYLSDHRPLTATLNTARLGLDLAAPHKLPKHSHTLLTTPITNKDREAYRLAVQQPSSGVPQLHAELTAFLAPIYTEATHHLATLGKTNPQQPQRLASVAGRPAREAVDTAATMLTHLLQTCRTAAIKTCNTKTLTRGGQHYQRRTMCRIRLALGRKLKTTRDLSRKANSLFKQTNVHPTIDELISGTDAINDEIRDAVQARQDEDPTENHVQAALAQMTNTYRDQIHQLDDDDSALAIAQARVRMQQLISTQPKKANKRILRPSRTDHRGLQALADSETKTICTAPADLNRIITAAYGQKLSAPTPKTGHYTNTQTRNYPWARAKADDAFAMHACQNIHWLHTAIMDKAGFQECLSRLAGGKAPGPDGVENEIIKMLPWEMRDTIHQLFIIMWATGCTPTTWKTSDTCLLYKDKGQETDLNSYRPVGLANTVYKLWTSLITKTLSEYAEANGMLSKNQAGFRSHRNTTQQLQMLVMALEDAKLAKADIYALLVDFTSAFNTTCQDKLLWIMHDLGFPTDATDAVKDLYTGATTRFKTPYGHTDPVPVNRGTIQGDSLSPFLFLIYIEPLLRWLQVGARGYKFKSAADDSGERATVSSIDYADDIAILCNTLRNLRCQADKLSAFSDWGHLIISHSKTLATAALHHSVETGMCSNAAEADKRARQQLQTVSLQGKPVTYHRPTSPFTYLGVLITMTLDWKPQHTAMITQLRQKLERLRRSFASARQAIHIIRTAIIPSLAYSFCAVPCTPGDLELYDRSINQCVKLKLRLPLGTPNAIIREDAGRLGIGISSTAQEYHARNTTALTHSLQSTDAAHAHISRSMLHKQITWLSAQASTQGHRMLTLLHHTLRARQLVYASISGLSATEEGLPLYHEECQTLGRLITQASSSQAHDVVSASITCLRSLGITHASELSCKGNTHIITGSMLTSQYGKKVKQKHIIALNKLAAMAAQPSCPDATATRAIRDSRNTSLDLPPDQRKITTWAAGLTELAPTPAVPDTRTRYMDMKAYAVIHATQPATADRAAAPPAAHEATRTSSRLLKREQRATQSAPTKPNPPKAGTKRNNEGRQTQTIPQDVVRIVGLDLPGLSSWKVDKACRCKPKNLGCILGAMYGHQEAITSIDGWQWDGINKENYYKVHWKPTVIDRWALPLCAEEGYTPTHIEPISREEAKDVCTCELCWLPRGDSPTCHNCKRAYHPVCLEEAHLSGHKEPGYWLCPICKFGSNDFKTTMRQSAHSDLIRVHWHPTFEPAPLITAHLDYMAKRSVYDEENRQIQEARHARPDTHLPAHTRQGLPDPHTWLPRCTNLHSKATFHTYPINPQTDIIGTGKCETFLQLHPHMTTPAMSISTGEPIMPQHDLVQHVTVHDESGRTIGLLTKDQHQHLHAWLQHTPHTRNLATEVAALLRRQDTQSSHHPMRVAQDRALTTLHTTRSFTSTLQRWADPLTVRPETTTYWSPDINDTAFGAHHNCLLVRHTGLSTWNVPADDAVALKCVNHAIHSATQEEAMATIMLIPGKKGISYPKHIDTLRRYPEYCQHLASIPPTKTSCTKSGKHATLHIYVIWNAAGQQLVTKGNPQAWLASTATALHPQRDTHPIHNRPTNQSQPATPPSGHKQHMHLPLDRDLPTAGHQRSHQQLTQHSTTQPRMAITEWATLAYSDGSCIKTSGAAPASVGAGVYIPETNVLITVALDGPESNTINKAELTAIHAALTAGAKRIATDSLCSIYQIRRALANPMSLITHRHNDILTAIATLIIDSPVTIHFYKVRAHSGIIGNEGADALAKHAALHPELANTPAYHPTTRKETNTWLSNEADGEIPAPLPDCRQSVRAHMHRKHKLGLANQDSIYYLMSQEITKVAAPGAGERVMTDAHISTHAQRTALLYRTGGLYNQKLALRWKRATDDRCPLCGEADSATHLLSGCSETLPLVQERHNGAGRLIVKAISKGTLGGYIRFADTGSWEKGAKENLDLPNDTLHTTLRALGLKTAATKNTTRPDILMVTPPAKAGKSGKVTERVTIIEIKYCSDSRWTDQLDRALNQHTNLAQTLRKEGHMVEIRPILLGIVVFFFFFLDPVLLQQLKVFCLYFANSNFLTPYNQLQRRLGRTVETDGVSVCVHYTRPLPPPPAPPSAAGPSSSTSSPAAAPGAAAVAAHELGLPRIGKGLAEQREFVFNPDTQIGVGIDPGVTQAVSAASGVWDPMTGQLQADQLRRWKLTKGEVKHVSGLNNARRDTERWLAPIKPHLQHLAAASSAGTSLEANLKHITVTLATWDAVWEVYLDPKWAEQRLRLYGAQDRTLEQFFKKLEEDMAKVSMHRHGRAKQLVVFFGAAGIGTRGGWGADAVLRACRKVVCRPRGTDQRRGRVVLVDEHRTSRVSSGVNGQQPCERQLNKRRATRPAGWKPPAGQVEQRLLRPAWSQQRDQPVRGMMWCPVVAPRKPPQSPRSSQEATPAAASEPGPSTPLPAKRSKRTKAEPAAEPTKGKGKAAKAKPAPQPGRWLDRDCNAALNMQRIGESRWRPLELCYWPQQGKLPAKGKEYPGLGYKRLRDKPPKAQQQQQPAEAQSTPQRVLHRCLRTMLIHKDLRFANGNPAFSCTLSLCKAEALNEHEAKGLSNDFLTIVSYWGNKPDLNVLFNLHVAHGARADVYARRILWFSGGPFLRLLPREGEGSAFAKEHTDCLNGHKAMVVQIDEARELLLAPVKSIQGKRGRQAPCCWRVHAGDDGRLTPVFWGYMLAPGLIAKVTEMLDKSLLAVVFDLDETLLMANTASSAESRMKSLQNARAKLLEDMRDKEGSDRARLQANAEAFAREEELVAADLELVRSFAAYDRVQYGGREYRAKLEEAAMEDGVTVVKRPVIRLEGDHLVLTRIDPAERKTSMVMRFRPGWPELLSVVAARAATMLRRHLCPGSLSPPPTQPNTHPTPHPPHPTPPHPTPPHPTPPHPTPPHPTPPHPTPPHPTPPHPTPPHPALPRLAGPPPPAEAQLGPAAAAVARRKFDVYVCTTAERQYALEVWRLVDPGNRIIPKDERRARITNVLQVRPCTWRRAAGWGRGLLASSGQKQEQREGSAATEASGSSSSSRSMEGADYCVPTLPGLCKNSQVCRQKALLSTLGLLRSPASEAVAAGLGSSKDDEGTGLLPMAVIVDDRQDVWQPCSQPHILQVMPWLYYRDEAHRQTGYNPSTATQSEGELKRVRDAIVQLRSSVYQSINTQVKPALDLIALHGASEQQQQQNMEGLVEVLRGVPLLLKAVDFPFYAMPRPGALTTPPPSLPIPDQPTSSPAVTAANSAAAPLVAAGRAGQPGLGQAGPSLRPTDPRTQPPVRTGAGPPAAARPQPPQPSTRPEDPRRVARPTPLTAATPGAAPPAPPAPSAPSPVFAAPAAAIAIKNLNAWSLSALKDVSEEHSRDSSLDAGLDTSTSPALRPGPTQAGGREAEGVGAAAGAPQAALPARPTLSVPDAPVGQEQGAAAAAAAGPPLQPSGLASQGTPNTGTVPGPASEQQPAQQPPSSGHPPPRPLLLPQEEGPGGGPAADPGLGEDSGLGRGGGASSSAGASSTPTSTAASTTSASDSAASSLPGSQDQQVNFPE